MIITTKRKHSKNSLANLRHSKRKHHIEKTAKHAAKSSLSNDSTSHPRDRELAVLHLRGLCFHPY